MSIATNSNKNIIQKKIFLPELATTVLLVAIPNDFTFADAYKKQMIHISIQNSQKPLCEYNTFLVTESDIFDTKILLTLYGVLQYKNAYFIDDLLGGPNLENVFKYNLIDAETTQRLYYQGLLEPNRSLVCKEILNHRLIHELLSNTCHALWYYYRTCITEMFLKLKSNGNTNFHNLYRNFCICNMEDFNGNIELQKFKILLVLQSKHVQNYYNCQSRIFQLLTHRRKNLYYKTSEELDQPAFNDNLLYSTNIYQNLNFWKALWNYYKIFFNTIPFTGRNFPKQTILNSKKPQVETTDFVKNTVAKIRRKLKGTLYNNTINKDNNSVSQQDVKDSKTTSNDDKSQYNSMEIHKDLKKYWVKRYRLFSKFDDGIKLDYESWFSVTPEKIAIHIADKCKSDIIIDAFCGAGGNSIQFANSCQQVLSIDIDLQKLLMARHNAQIYGVDNKIDFILGNFFCLADHLIGDVVFLSPPWGGPKYVKKNVFDLKNIMEPYGGEKLLKTAQKISRNIAYYLPKNIDTSQLLRAAGSETRVEVEKNFLNDQVVAVTAYYGDLVDKTM